MASNTVGNDRISDNMQNHHLLNM